MFRITYLISLVEWQNAKSSTLVFLMGLQLPSYTPPLSLWPMADHICWHISGEKIQLMMAILKN